MVSPVPAKRSTTCALLLSLALAPAAAATPVAWTDPGEIVSLAVPWKFRVGDDPAWAHPDYDDRLWREIRGSTSN